MISRTLPLIAAALLFSVVSCDDGGGDPDAGDTDTTPEPICLEVTDDPGVLSFTDVTEELGLGAAGLVMTGNNVAIADVDGDRWPDIVVTKGSSAQEDPEAPAGLYRLFRSVAGTGFEDWTWSSDLFLASDGDQGREATFVLFADVDNDGDKDAFSAVYETTDNDQDLEHRTVILLNDGAGRFELAPEQEFSSAVLDPLVSATFLDWDHDGLLDVFAGHHYMNYGYLDTTVQDSLFAGDGQGGFTDVTDEVGLTTFAYSATTAAAGTNHKPTWGTAACDVDGDGWTDLMATSYGRQFNPFYRNVDGLFEDLTLTSGFGSDDNEDYSDNQFFRCYCQANPTASDCDGVPAPSIGCDGITWGVGTDDQPFRLGGNSSNTVCGDVDNDGDLDLLAVELRHWHIGESSDKTELLINDGFPQAPLSRPGNDVTGLTRNHIQSWNEGDLGGLMADLDNDGRLDVLVASSDYPGTYSLLWQQRADGTFAEVGGEAGARVHRAHGLGLVDFDRDGDYDLVVGTSLARWYATDTPPAPDDAYAYLLRNDTGQAANKVMLRLVGAGAGGANRDALGARVTVTAGGRTYVREVEGGRGLTGYQQDDLLIIGIGAACEVEDVTVRWPNAAMEEVSYAGIMPNHVAVIEEGQDPVMMTLEDYTAAE